MRTSLKLIPFLLSSIVVVSGCSNPHFKAVTAQLLGATGYVSSTEADAFLNAGEKFTKAATPLSDEQEYYVGRSVSAMILSQYSVLRNDTVQQYVNRVGRAVVSFSDRPEIFGGYRFVVLDSAEVNALSAPGGFVFISKGLLALMPDEDALAAVIAHEIGHIVNSDGVNAISSANMSSAVLDLGKAAASSRGPASLQLVTSAFGDGVNEVFDTLIHSGYSRSQEYSADQYAAQLLTRAGYDPQALIKMLDALNAADEKGSKSGMFATHPSPEKRSAEVAGDLGSTGGAGAGGRAIRAQRFKVAVAQL